nr:MAG TPA: hypothetical protein [Caudoviricetes sp.]
MGVDLGSCGGGHIASIFHVSYLSADSKLRVNDAKLTLK